MKKIEVLGKEMIFGNFRSSDYGLIVGSFTFNGNSEDELGMGLSVIEEFIGHNPTPVYLGQMYNNKLKPQITLVKKPDIYNNLYFSEKDCRSLLRILTGRRSYEWLKVVTHELDEDLCYKAKAVGISYRRIGTNVAGIIINMECDSCFAWSNEYNININAKKNQYFYIFNNTDDLNNYIYPEVSILSSSTSNGTLSVTNMTDNWKTEIKNIKSNEKITIDSQNQIISSSVPHALLLNDFNLGWFRLVPDKNEYVSNSDIIISMKFRVPRKVGFME